MALPRVCSLGRGLVFRGATTRAVNSVFLSGRITTPHRSFVSTSRYLKETLRDATSSSTNSHSSASPASVPEEQRRKNARSVKVLKVPRHAMRSQVEANFTDAGFKVIDVHMNLDRFRFEGDTYASVELADEQQAHAAIKILNGNESLGSKVYLRALNPEFDWDTFQTAFRNYSYFVRADEAGTRKAVQPLIEGRRVRISVRSPAWGSKGDTPTQRRNTDMKVLERAFDRFGIESISRLSPQYGHTTYHPKYFCHIDFTTKEGAEEAIRTSHDTEIEGVLVWAKRTEVDPTKAFQIGRVNKGLLAELQEKGLAPADAEIHEDWVSKSAKKDLMNFDRHRNWQDKTRSPHVRAYRPKRETVETTAE